MSSPSRSKPVQRLTGDRLKEEDVDRIVAELKRWSGPKITWKMVVAAVAQDWLKQRRFSRQALEADPDIYRAYRKAKERCRDGRPPEKRKPLADRIATLQGENLRLRAENAALLETFVIWMLNAKDRGVGLDELEAPLIPARLSSNYREADVARKEAEKAEELAKLKRLIGGKAGGRLAV
ncbi:hypothetical protein JOE51_004151 [Bradyrhizobium japonicum]|uniref:Uncharacterized protein n=1 Tax=Bradyrhizobium diazoefficiens TaxID=1355477 RepID=A0A809Y0E0_9BRAD|nr:hypothetical protein [Bradyrhizobium japonicum]BCE33626.1 hypothetical protein XF2B_73950 [Bradyrhizobium diazoefficiens]BCF20703.1 hypothetical protein XF13B_73940 [Bradyrhizobium diazoefficiens]